MIKYKNLIVFCLLSFASATYGQTVKENISKDFTTYHHLIAEQNFEKAMNFIPDQFFEIFPKENMIKVIQQLYNNKEFTFKIYSVENVTIADPVLVEGKHYVLIDYSSPFSMKY